MLDHTGTADTDIDDAVALGNAVECASHEGIVSGGIAEHDDLGAAESLLLARQLRRALDHIAHLAHGIHIDARLRRADVDRRADNIRRRHRLRNGVDEHAVAVRHSLFDECRKSANEVDPDRLARAIECLRHRDEGIRLTRIRCNPDGRDRDTFIDDGDAVLRLDVLARLNEILRRARDLLIDILAELLEIWMGTVPQGDSHRNGTHIEAVFCNHPIGFTDVLKCNQSAAPCSNLVHDLENLLMLNLDLKSLLLALLPQNLLQLLELDLRIIRHLGNHHHVEKTIHNILVHIHDVDALLGKNPAHHRHNTDLIPSDYRYNQLHLCHSSSICPHGLCNIYPASYQKTQTPSTRDTHHCL